MKPCYFIPGWCLGRRPILSTVNALGGEILDLPGYNGTPLITDFYDAADALAEKLPDGASLAGWSIGAQLALEIAVRHPKKVGKLVLVAGTASFVAREGWQHAMPPEMLVEFSKNVMADIEAILPRFIGGFNRGDARAKEVTQELLSLADPRPSSVVLAAGLSWLESVDQQESAKKVSAKTLLVHGEADPLMPLAAAKALSLLIPNARLCVLADSAHAPFLSQPEKFLDLVRGFLS